MSTISYRKLSNDAREIIERNQVIHELFLDFLTYLHDVLSVGPPAIEPAHFDRNVREQRIEEIISDFRSDSDLGKIARENFEKAASLASKPAIKDFEKFFFDMLSEYDSVREIHMPDLLQPVSVA